MWPHVHHRGHHKGLLKGTLHWARGTFKGTMGERLGSTMGSVSADIHARQCPCTATQVTGAKCNHKIHLRICRDFSNVPWRKRAFGPGTISVATPAEPRCEKKLVFVHILGGEKLLKFVEKCR